jgi:hypothetical protein
MLPSFTLLRRGIALIALATCFAGCSTSTGPTQLHLPTPAGTASPEVVYRDPLTADQGFGWPVDAYCAFKADGYHVTQSRACFAPTGDFTDATISVTLSQFSGVTTAPAGLAFRVSSDESSFYSFRITSGGQWESRLVQNTQITPLTPLADSAAIKRGVKSANTLMVAIHGATFTFFINGTNVGQTVDATLATGGFGLEGGFDGAEDVFTNFVVTVG